MTRPVSRGRNPLDWDAVRAELERASQGMNAVLRPPPERVQTILEQRSKALARPLDGGLSPEAMVDIITFSLGSERYGVGVRHVREVIRWSTVTPLPGGARVNSGVVNLRGEIVPVMDLRPLLGLPSSPPAEFSAIIVLGADRAEVGISVDEFGDIVSVKEADVVPPPPMTKREPRVLLGVTTCAVGLLDGDVLLSDNPFLGERST